MWTDILLEIATPNESATWAWQAVGMTGVVAIMTWLVKSSEKRSDLTVDRYLGAMEKALENNTNAFNELSGAFGTLSRKVHDLSGVINDQSTILKRMESDHQDRMDASRKNQQDRDKVQRDIPVRESAAVNP
jgi:hypothetical protein